MPQTLSRDRDLQVWGINLNPSVSYCYRSGLEDVKLEPPSPRGFGSATACSTAPVEVPELTAPTHNPPLANLTHSHARVNAGAAAACSPGFSAPSPSFSAEETPGAFALGHGHRACPRRSKADSAGLQAPGVDAERVQRNPPQLEGHRRQRRQPQAVLPLWRTAEERFPLSKPKQTAHLSARSSLLPTGIRQCLKSGLSILQNWDLSLEGFALKEGK